MVTFTTSDKTTHTIDDDEIDGVELADETEAKHNIHARLHLRDGTHYYLPSSSFKELPTEIKRRKRSH